MKLSLIVPLLVLVGCAVGTSALPDVIDASSNDAGVNDASVCPLDACGKITDSTGNVIDCGSCGFHSQCGDNSIPNVCGSACMPLTNSDLLYPHYNTSACDYVFGPAWWVGYAANGVQYPSACNYTDQNNCIEIYIPVEQNKPCRICGQFWCCIDDPAQGINSLLPGAVAH